MTDHNSQTPKTLDTLHNIEAEERLLANIIYAACGSNPEGRNTKLYDQTKQTLNHQDFHHHLHQTIWESIPHAIDDPLSRSMIDHPLATQVAKRGYEWTAADVFDLKSLSAGPRNLTKDTIALTAAIKDLANKRRTIAICDQISDTVANGNNPEHLLHQLTEVAHPFTGDIKPINDPEGQIFTAFNYGTLQLDLTPIWGDDEIILWAAGEPAYLCAASGVGKSTIAMQLIAARAGLHPNFLGHPVKRCSPDKGILYIAADRPQQLLRMFKTMYSEQDMARLDDDLMFCHGYPQGFKGFNHDPDMLVKLADQYGPLDTIIIDSAKDFSSSLTEEAGGSAFNKACQIAVLAGIEIFVLHHERKSGTDNEPGRIPTLDKIYGSAMLTAGAGSVLALQRSQGSNDVTMHQVKSAAGELDPMTLRTNWNTGRTSVVEPDVIELAIKVIIETGPITRTDLASDLLPKGTGRKPSDVEVQRAKRKLEAAVKDGRLVHIPRLGDKKTYYGLP